MYGGYCHIYPSELISPVSHTNAKLSKVETTKLVVIMHFNSPVLQQLGSLMAQISYRYRTSSPEWTLSLATDLLQSEHPESAVPSVSSCLQPDMPGKNHLQAQDVPDFPSDVGSSDI